MSNYPQLTPERFFEEGYAHEVNSIVLNPLGLALTLISENGSYRIGILDYRNLEAGVIYSDSVMRNMENFQKSYRIQSEYKLKAENRIKRYGFLVQPFIREGDGNVKIKND
jgi:hypothetical protein